MKICKQCGAQVQDDAAFCTKCGAKMEQGEKDPQGTQRGAGPQSGQGADMNQSAYSNQGAGMNGMNQNIYGNAGNNMNQGAYQYYGQAVDIYDHTSEFDQKDISDNKVIAMVVYLLGTIGIIIALLASRESAYAAFHVRQALKFTVLSVLTGLIALIFCWTIIVPIAAGIFVLVLFVCKIIAFFSICGGKAKEPYIVRSFGFMR